MPIRFSARSSEAEGPKPFSSEWLAADRPVSPPREGFRLPAWIPDGRAINRVMLIGVTVAAVAAALRFGHGLPTMPAETTPSPESAAMLAAISETPMPIPPPTLAPTAAVVAPTNVPVDVAQEQPAEAATVAPDPAQAPIIPAGEAAPADAFMSVALLPSYRIVAYYGHPHDPNMGIIGEESMELVATQLRQEAENYEAVDPSRTVIPAFELIATVAQRVPGADGTYILDTDVETLTSYIDYAEANGMIVILDLQVGRGTVADEIEKVRELLARPNVHLAIDPEFAVAEGEIPGEYIGSLPAEAIQYAQQTLAEISQANGLPPKLLVVHQFREDMIRGKDQLGPYPGVQLVIDADGYGAPELKTAVFNFLVRNEPVEFAGVKLFYKQDVPLMSPKEILDLVPSPDVIIYQ